jgi:hypothetical protein
MNDKPSWNEASREDLRESLRNLVRGEVRLARSDHEDILQRCRDVCDGEECPEAEQSGFIQFATAELAQAASTHSAEQANWPPQTDCDRLDSVEAKLREKGILLWQASPCCDTCTSSELPERSDVITGRYSGFRDRLRGYAFFIDQNLPERLAESTGLSVYLGYGWVPPDDSPDVAKDVYEERALGIAHEICNCLREHGFEPDWGGDFSRKIGVSLDWKRRTLLT